MYICAKLPSGWCYACDVASAGAVCRERPVSRAEGDSRLLLRPGAPGKKEPVSEKASHRFVRRKLQNVSRNRHLFRASPRTCAIALRGQCQKWLGASAAKSGKSSEKTVVCRTSACRNLCARFGALRLRSHRFVSWVAARRPKSSGKTRLATKTGRRTCWVVVPPPQDRRENGEFLGKNAPGGRSWTANLCDPRIGFRFAGCRIPKTLGKNALRGQRRPAILCDSHVGLTHRRSPRHRSEYVAKQFGVSQSRASTIGKPCDCV